MFEVIKISQEESWTDKLVEAAERERPKSPNIREFLESPRDKAATLLGRKWWIIASIAAVVVATAAGSWIYNRQLYWKEQRTAFDETEKKSDIAAWSDYLAKRPDPYYAELAENKKTKLVNLEYKPETMSCIRVNSDGHCVFCESHFLGEDDLLLGEQMRVKEYRCTNMPENTNITSLIAARYTVTRLDVPRMTCATSHQFGGSGYHMLKRRYLAELNTWADCSGIRFEEGTTESPVEQGIGKARISMGCTYGREDRECRLFGTVRVFSGGTDVPPPTLPEWP